MFSRKKDVKPKPTKRGSGLAQYGLFDIPNVDDLNSAGGDSLDDSDDEDLEAELLALTGGSKPPPRPQRAAPLPPEKLNKLVEDCLKTDESDDESVDENDPELLAELNEIEGVNAEQSTAPEAKVTKIDNSPIEILLFERLKLYTQAETSAKNAGDTSKARRYNRGIRTLNELINSAKKGVVINEADIPPPVSVNAGNPPSTTTQTPVSPSSPLSQNTVQNDEPNLASEIVSPVEPSNSDQLTNSEEPKSSEEPNSSEEPAESCSPEVIAALVQRQNEYKKAALALKRSGDKVTALDYIKVVKQFDLVIQGAKEGKPIDLSEMPDTPPEISQVPSNDPAANEPPVQTIETQKSSDEAHVQVHDGQPSLGDSNSPSTPLEALEQRLAVFLKSEESAKAENNSSKARRVGRIVKQYKDAIKAYKAGRPIPYDELPTPPGFPLIPGAPQPTSSTTQGDDSNTLSVPSKPGHSQSPSSSKQPSPQPSPKPTKRLPDDETSNEPSPKIDVRKIPGSRQEKQSAILIERQAIFKKAALEAKKNGDLELAKEYLRNCKGLEPLIQASNCGLPIDMNTVPLPPDERSEIETGFDVVTIADNLTGTNDEIFTKLQEDLKNQMKMCMRTRDHYKAVGDIGNANKFERLALHSKKDLDVVRACVTRDSLPQFHYETRTFSIVQCNTDLTDNDLELTIIQGINYNVAKPKDVDTYVKIEFPYPTEEPVKKKTSVIYDSNNPQYDAVFTIPIQRNVRACQRAFKRQTIKCEVYSRGCKPDFYSVAKVTQHISLLIVLAGTQHSCLTVCAASKFALQIYKRHYKGGRSTTIDSLLK